MSGESSQTLCLLMLSLSGPQMIVTNLTPICPSLKLNGFRKLPTALMWLGNWLDAEWNLYAVLLQTLWVPLVKNKRQAPPSLNVCPSH